MVGLKCETVYYTLGKPILAGCAMIFWRKTIFQLGVLLSHYQNVGNFLEAFLDLITVLSIK